MSTPDRRARLDRDHPNLSVRRQCALLGLARSGVYREPTAANDNELALLRRIDELFTAWPFLGSRRITALLRAEGRAVNRKRVQRLMRWMGIAALGPKPRTTKPAPGHKNLPVFASGFADRAAEPGLGGGHHLRPDRPRLLVSGGDHGLAEPGGAGLAVVEHDGRVVLRFRAGRSAEAVRQAGDLQHRSGEPIHQRGVHRHAARGRDQSVDGRARAVAGQRVH